MRIECKLILTIDSETLITQEELFELIYDHVDSPCVSIESVNIISQTEEGG